MLRNVICFFTAFAWTAFLFPFACLSILVTLNPAASIWLLRRIWSPVLLRAGGATLVVEGREHVDPARPTIYVSNHQSAIDVPTLFMALPVNVRFVAKEQLRWVPCLGWYMWLAGYVFVDRGNPRRTRASLEKAGRRIRAGTNIILFAEGTRSPDGGLLPFKKGAFVLALEAGVPLCPVTIEGSGRLMPKSSWRITPGEIRVRIGAPIDISKGFHDREQLMRHVREVMLRQAPGLGEAPAPTRESPP